ncbi:MAG: hypothetical protein P1U56_13630 [Saprospiraceae bacterium]|nr:hypothetical protein [Saprospiraceae bacterium]
MKHLINFFLLLVPFVGVTAQNTIDKGYVKIEVTEATSDNPQAAMQLEMMKGTVTEVFFKDGKYKTSMSMMGGMINMTNLVNQESNAMDMLIDAMGQKMWVNTNIEEAKKTQPGAQDMSDFKVEYDKSVTKTILGYEAYKTTITGPSTGGMKIEGFVTEEIKTDANIIQGMEDLKLAGFPLEFSIVNPQMTLTFTATDIKGEVADSDFVLNTEGFKKMTQEEFAEMMNAMGGGMGF